MLDCLDWDIEGLLEELCILRCDVAVINIEYGKVCLNSGNEFAIQVVKRLAHDPQPLKDHHINNNIE